MPLDQVDVDEYEAQMTFLEHLEALRWHLVRSLVAVVIGAIFAFIKGPYIFDKILLGPTREDFWSFRKLCELGEKLGRPETLCIGDMNFVVKTVNIQEQFYQHFMIAAIGGLVFAMPYILFEIYRFIKPALKRNEKKYNVLNEQERNKTTELQWGTLSTYWRAICSSTGNYYLLPENIRI